MLRITSVVQQRLLPLSEEGNYVWHVLIALDKSTGFEWNSRTRMHAAVATRWKKDAMIITAFTSNILAAFVALEALAQSLATYSMVSPLRI